MWSSLALLLYQAWSMASNGYDEVLEFMLVFFFLPTFVN